MHPFLTVAVLHGTSQGNTQQEGYHAYRALCKAYLLQCASQSAVLWPGQQEYGSAVEHQSLGQ